MTQQYEPNYSVPPSSGKMGQLKVVGILMIVFGALSLLGNIYLIFSVLVQAASGAAHPPPGPQPAGFEGGFYIGFYSPLVLAILAIPLTAIMIFGAVAMIRQKGYRTARTGAILAIIPLTAGCCCILTLPFGIWSLILLNSQEIKDAFQANG